MNNWVSVENGMVEVGDIIRSKNNLGGSHNYKITRVTKTLSLSKREDGYELRFKRQIQWDMAHPRLDWNTSNYKVFRQNEKDSKG